MLVLVLAFALSQSTPPLGTELRRDGYALRPPVGFRIIRQELFARTRVGAVASAPKVERQLSAALVEGDSDQAATLLISWVDEGFSAGPGARDTFQTDVVRHFSDELGQKLSLETARVVKAAVPRVEVTGTLKEEVQQRRVLVAAMDGEPRHLVFVLSAPSSRFDALKPAVEASLDSLQIEAPPGAGLSRGLLGALMGAALGALVVSFSLWRTQRRRRHADSPP